MRYASLHRAIEKGIASDSVWSELARVCAQMGLDDEARSSFAKIEDPGEKLHVQNVLLRHGLIDRAEAARTAAMTTPVKKGRHDLKEELFDAFHFLFVDHMPLTVIVATLTFPLVVGLGGALTAGSPFFLFPAIALLPGLAVLGLIGALGRRIMIEASQGIDDAPSIPEIVTLFREAARFLLDGLVLGTLFLGPAVGLLAFGAPVGISACAAVLGAVFLPMAMLIREVSNDWRALQMPVLTKAITKAGYPYFVVIGSSIALFLPAAAACAMTIGSQLYLQISVIGPLVVVPLFVVSRLVGRLYALRRADLAPLIGVIKDESRNDTTIRVNTRRRKTNGPTVTKRRAKPGTARPSGARPAARAGGTAAAAPGLGVPATRSLPTGSPATGSPATGAFGAVRPKPQSAPRAAPPSSPRAPAAPAPAPAQRFSPDVSGAPSTRRLNKPASTLGQGTPLGATPERRTPAPAPASRPRLPGQPQPPSAESDDPATQAIAGHLERIRKESPRHLVGEPIPDITKMPGFRVISEEDRELIGASPKNKQLQQKQQQSKQPPRRL